MQIYDADASFVKILRYQKSENILPQSARVFQTRVKC